MSNGNGRTAKRLIAGGVLGLSGLAFAPLSPAGAAISTDAFCANVPSGQSGFTDIAQAGVHTDNVECLKASEITVGTTPTTYSPTANVTRGQMATFIANMIDKANELDAPGGTTIPDLPTAAASADAFTDDETSVHENNINRLAQADIVQGQTATTFNPSGNVSRAQMATFIAEALEFIRGAALPEGTDAFTDDETSVHEANINRLATADIVDGTGPGTYNPNGLVSRAQMASFIIQALADLHADGFITPLPGPAGPSNQSFTADKTTTQVLADSETSPSVVEINFSGLTPGVEYDIYLFPCNDDSSGSAVFSNGQPFVGPNGESRMTGTISFNDDEGGTGGQPDDIADDFGTTNGGELGISLVGSTPAGDSATAEDFVAPANGTLRVTIQADGDNDCAIPVIIEDPAATDADTFALKDANEDTLENDDTPVRKFGVGPAVVGFDGVAENGDEPDSDAEFVGAASLFPNLLGTGDDVGVAIHDHGDSLVGVDFDNDNFFYSGSEFEGPITRAQARDYLTVGDNFGTCDGESACNSIDTPYTRTGANNWLFDGTDELPSSPSGVTLTAGNFDGDGTTANDDVNVSWTAPSFGAGMGGDVDEYFVEIWNTAAADAGSVDDDSTDEVDSQQTGDAPTTLTCTAADCAFEDLPPGTYRARVQADSETDNQSGWSPWSEPLTITVAGAPISVATVTDNANANNMVDTGDTLRARFDQALADTADGDDESIVLQDADGTICTFSESGSADFSEVDEVPATAGAETLVIAVNGVPSCSSAGTTGGLQYPATVVNAVGITDADQNFAWNIAGSTDKTFE